MARHRMSEEMTLRLHPSRAAALSAVLLAATPAFAVTYAIDFVATAAGGAVMDPSGSIIGGLANLAPTCVGCPPTFSVPSLWIDGKRFTLTPPANRAYFGFVGANAQGWVLANAWDGGSTTATPVLWKVRPDRSGYDTVELPPLPGRASAAAAGLDNQGRVVGVSNTWFSQPDEAFMWTQAGGIVTLTGMGHVGDKPLAISPGGTVATGAYTYTLGDPASLTPMSPPPPGWSSATMASTVVNDGGDRGFAMLTTAPSNKNYYTFRYHADGVWQQIGFTGTGPMSSGGVGAIDPSATIIGTELSQAFRAEGPAGGIVALSSLLSAAYPGVTLTGAGALSSSGQILASSNIGRAGRLTRLVPVQPCVANCMRVATLNVAATIIWQRGKPGQCTARAKTSASAQVKVVDGNGLPVSGAVVSGRFLDDYYLDHVVSLTTNAQGVVKASHSGPACVGAIAFFVDAVTKAGRTLDRTTGKLTSFVIPQ
jgi:hypothetical protein